MSGSALVSCFGPVRKISSTRTLEIVLRRLLPSVVLRGRRRHQARARWNASIGVGALQFLRCLHPVIRHLEHHILVLLALCTGCPTQALSRYSLGERNAERMILLARSVRTRLRRTVRKYA